MTWLIELVNAKRIASLELIVIAVLVLYSWNRTQELYTARVALKNPKTIEVVRTVTVAGPVRVVTKIVEKPGGDRETTVVEERAEVRETTESSETKEPVALAELARPHRVSRWVAALDIRDLDVRNHEAYTVYGGYSFGNRLDVLAGVGHRDDWESHLMLAFRF